MNPTLKTVLITLAILAVAVQTDAGQNLLTGRKRYF